MERNEIMSEQRIVCEVCHQQQKSPKGLGQHVRRQHGLSAQEYYDQYVKADDNEGICPICGKATPFRSIQRGYQEFCSANCANKSEAKRDAIKQHIAERTEEEQAAINAKVQATLLEHYGDENYGRYGSVGFKKKMLEKYGDEHYSNTAQKLETNRRNHGGVLNLQLPEFREQARATKIARYGCDHDMNKVIQTNIERYGVPFPANAPEAIASRSERRKAGTRQKMESLLAAEDISVLEYDGNVFRMLCSQCGNEFTYSRAFLYYKQKAGDVCPFCHPRNFSYDSNLQAAIADFVDASTDLLVARDNRTEIWPQELDIYIPDLQVAFEVDGMYWHSLAYKKPTYHLEKTLLCRDAGITLYHIFEAEWESRQEIVKSRIRSILGQYDARIYARNCDLREVTAKEARHFFETNHLQGSALASVTYGLYYEGELVEAMSFGKPRFNKECSWELIRMCSKLNHQIVGGAARLLKAFEKEHPGEGRLISYADLRWSTGSVYETLGFEHMWDSKPNYWYFMSNEDMFSRGIFQKHKLPSILPKFDPDMTEQENMLENGFQIIYDCGNAVYEKVL